MFVVCRSNRPITALEFRLKHASPRYLSFCMATFHKRKCASCREELHGNLAHPDCCPHHLFHRECLLEHAKRRKRCPMDANEFYHIVCDDGSRIDVSQRRSSHTSTHHDGNLVQEFDKFMTKIAGAAVGDPQPSSKKETRRKSFFSFYMTSSNFRCVLCHQSGEAERAKVAPCKHEFHRACLRQYTQTHVVCPMKDCHEEITEIHCQDGSVGVIKSPVRQLINLAGAHGSFKCRICDKDDASQERAYAKPCSHPFHRRCLVQRCKSDSRCMSCKQDISEIHCDFSPAMKVEKKRSEDCKSM